MNADREQIAAIRQAYKLLYKSGLTLEQAKLALDQELATLSAEQQPHVQAFRDFLDVATRGIVR